MLECWKQNPCARHTCGTCFISSLYRPALWKEKNILHICHPFMLTWLTVFSVCSLTIRCRQILRTAPLKAVLFLFCWLGFRLCFAGLRWAYVRFKVMRALCNVSNDFSAMRSFKKEALWAWAAESRWRFLQVTGDHDVTPRRDSLPLVLVPRWRSYFELDKRGNWDTPLQSHTFPMTLTFRWRAWLILDCVKVGLSFFFFFLIVRASPWSGAFTSDQEANPQAPCWTDSPHLSFLFFPLSPKGSVPRTSPGTDEEHLLHCLLRAVTQQVILWSPGRN